MKRIAGLLILVVVGSLSMGVISRYDIALTANPWMYGKFTQYRNFAAEEWRADTPERTDGAKWKIIGEYNGNHQFVWYYDGAFRGASGGKWSKPARWAYLRVQEEKWDGGSWVMPDGTGPTDTDTVVVSVGDIDGIMRLAMSKHTVKQIMDAMDKNKGLEGTGAPEK